MFHLLKISRVSVLLCTVLLYLFEYSRGELFTAVCDIEPLLETHKRIIEDLDDYMKKEERRLDIVKRYISIYKREHEKAMQDVSDYLGNPINAFTLIKRMTTDLEFVKQTVDTGTENAKGIMITEHSDMKYPTLEDLTGAAQALTRLQETYHLDVADLAEGRLIGAIRREDILSDTDEDMVAASSTMNAGDCYELGKILYNEKDFTGALAWMVAAHRKFTEDNTPYAFLETDILEHISLSHSSLGNVREALNWIEKVLELDQSHSRALEYIAHFQRIVAEKNNTSENITKETEPLDWYAQQKKKYEALCRGEQEISSEISPLLKCRYFNENSYLKLAPIKMEYKYLNPDIVLFHEVLSEDEIEHIKELAQPRFRRATVRDRNTGGLLPVNYRISKSAWLADEESGVIARVSRRVAHFTGLDLGTAEQLQVVNYGIGGHYEPHFDFSRKHEIGFPENQGNRIATVLFYMSDVAQGGATVFTELGLSLFPVRGSAAVWLNLHASGEGDLATRHAACPVLRGSKWVCNKWIHQIGQELIRPCTLEHQKEQ